MTRLPNTRLAMPSAPTINASVPEGAGVTVRLVAPDAPEDRAIIELWTLSADGLALQPTSDADLTQVLKQASELSHALGLHRSYELIGEPDDIAANVRTWLEKRAALAEVRAQRELLGLEAIIAQLRADGTRKTAIDRANAVAMMNRLARLRDALMRRGFVIDAGAIAEGS